MSTRRGKAVFGIGLVVFGFAVFMLASAYLVARDQPKWLAAAVGALGFPVVPVLWHILGERRRRARLSTEKTPPKTTLAAGDRYLLRAFVVAAAVLAPMFVIGRFAVIRAAWDHKTWFIPDPHFDSIESTDELFSHVPADADAVLLIRDHDKTNDKLGVGIVAYGDHQLAMIAPDDAGDTEHKGDKIKELNDQRGKIPFVKIDTLDTVALGKGMFAVATERWKSAIRVAGAGPRVAIKNELAKAPSDAVLSLAYVPAKPVDGIEKMTGWMIQKGTNEKLTIEGRVDAVDAPAAERFVDTVRALWKVQRSELPETCRDEVAKVTDAAELERKGAVVTFHVSIQPGQLMSLMLCGMKGAKLDDE